MNLKLDDLQITSHPRELTDLEIARITGGVSDNAAAIGSAMEQIAADQTEAALFMMPKATEKAIVSSFPKQ